MKWLLLLALVLSNGIWWDLYHQSEQRNAQCEGWLDWDHEYIHDMVEHHQKMVFDPIASKDCRGLRRRLQ